MWSVDHHSKGHMKRWRRQSRLLWTDQSTHGTPVGDKGGRFCPALLCQGRTFLSRLAVPFMHIFTAADVM
jgi:hypothetical protein